MFAGVAWELSAKSARTSESVSAILETGDRPLFSLVTSCVTADGAAQAAVAQAYGAGVLAPGTNPSLVLDFEVEDVDALYARLKNTIGEWVQPPTTQPWGNRSMLLRDPDGNLINMFATPIVPSRTASEA